MGCVQLLPFLAGHVGVEDESPFVETLHEDHANIGQAIRIDRGERHRGRIAWLAPCRIREPGGKQAQRLVGFGKITGR